MDSNKFYFKTENEASKATQLLISYCTLAKLDAPFFYLQLLIKISTVFPQINTK